MKLALAGLLLATASTISSAATVFSENFDSYSPRITATGQDYLLYNNTFSNGGITGWSLSDIDLVQNQYGAISGVSLDLNGNEPGALTRSFNTTVGEEYTLTFDRSTNGAGATFEVFFGTFSNNTFASFSAGLGSHTFSFFGDGRVATLYFQSAGPGNAGSVIDNISVTTAVPEPGEWAMMLAGLSVVGLIARRRKGVQQS